MNLDSLFVELRAEHFSADLPLPSLRWNKRMSTSAGRFCPAPNALIEIAHYLRALPDGHTHIRDTLLHEMIHYQLWWQKKPYGHTPEFYSIMKRTGATRFNTVPKLRPVKHWYQCPSCLQSVPARRTLGKVACAKCCNKFNQGHFAPQFILQKVSAPTVTPSISYSPKEPPLFIKTDDLIQRLRSLKELIRSSV
jgi:predicted SprT family Zn-dependent metalloprotease